MNKLSKVLLVGLLLFSFTLPASSAFASIEDLNEYYTNKSGIYYERELTNTKEIQLKSISGTAEQKDIKDFSAEIFMDDDYYDIYAEELKYNSELELYEGFGKWYEQLNKKTYESKVFLNPGENILSLIIIDDNEVVSFISFNELEPTRSLMKLKQETTVAKSETIEEQNSPMALDSNIRAKGSVNKINMEFVGAPSISKGNYGRYSMRLGADKVFDRNPTMATMRVSPNKYSTGHGIDVNNVYPKTMGSLQIGVGYSFKILNIGYSAKRTLYSVGYNSAPSHVSVDINSANGHWTGVSTNTDGVAADFYFNMMGGVTGSCYGYSLSSSMIFVGSLGMPYEVAGPSSFQCIRVN